MKIYRKTFFVILLLIGLLTFNGCAKNEYREFKVQFNNIYSKIAKSVDTTDTNKALQDIKSDENKNRIKELRVLLKNIKDKVPEAKKEEYHVYIEWYNGLILLKEASYSQWNEYTFIQKSNVWTEIAVLNARKE